MPEAHRRETGFGGGFHPLAKVVGAQPIAERIRPDREGPIRSENLSGPGHTSVSLSRMATSDARKFRREAAIGNAVIHGEGQLGHGFHMNAAVSGHHTIPLATNRENS